MKNFQYKRKIVFCTVIDSARKYSEPLAIQHIIDEISLKVRAIHCNIDAIPKSLTVLKHSHVFITAQRLIINSITVSCPMYEISNIQPLILHQMSEPLMI